jgi:molybdopterin/thiamine biosynthesis adenylyltransferase
MRWWDRYPDRLTREVDRLKACGFITAFDPASPKGDVIELSASYTLDGREYQLRILFPDLYPYFRPQVYAPGLSVPHHQNPFDGNLCLIGRNSDNWDPTFYIADVIADQLPKLLDSEKVEKAGDSTAEELQAEPWTEYLPSNPEFRIAWNTDINVPAGSTGKVELTYKLDEDVYQAYVSGLTSGGKVLFTETLAHVHEAKSKSSIPFIRLDSVPPDLKNLEEIVQSRLSDYKPQGLIKRLTHRTRGAFLALFYPEETAYRNNGTGLVLVLFRKSLSGNVNAEYIKTYRVGGDSGTARLGTYGSIRDNKVLLVGFGSIGSMVTADLCRLGVREITIVDRDVFEPGNTVRHYLGMQYFGMDKVAAASDALGKAYPCTKITAISYRLGDSGREVTKRTDEFFRELKGADVIVDCSAERAVQQLLSDAAWNMKKRYFFVEAYPGVLGGFIGLVEPGSGPCFYCFLRSLVSGSTQSPPVLNTGMVQPVGCGEPTFVGTPFDAETIAAAAVRLVFGTLAKAGNYPKPSSNYYRAVLANEDTTLSNVVIEPIHISKTAGCDVCDKP